LLRSHPSINQDPTNCDHAAHSDRRVALWSDHRADARAAPRPCGGDRRGAVRGRVAAFLLIARPTATREFTLRPGDVLPLAIGLAAILAGCLVVAPRRRGRPMALALAVAAGVLYGVAAG